VPLSLIDGAITIADFSFAFSDIQYECYQLGNGDPCLTADFVEKRDTKYPNFEKDSEKLLNAIDQKKCIVLELKEDDLVWPWSVCPKEAADVSKLQRIIRDTFSEEVTSMPLEEMPDDVKIGDEFELDMWVENKNGKLLLNEGTFYIGE